MSTAAGDAGIEAVLLQVIIELIVIIGAAFRGSEVWEACTGSAFAARWNKTPVEA